MPKISATILTYNEERRIEACLESLRGIADEIIIVDSFSTDTTLDICRRYGCRISQRKLTGFGAQRQYATSLTTHPYVLAIDADEVLSPTLRTSLLRLKEHDFAHRVYSISRLNFFCGYAVKHCGWYPDRQIRLFDKRYANWNLSDVEERVIFRDNVRPEKVDGDILHYRCSTESEFRETENKHAMLLAKNLVSRGIKPGVVTPYLQGIKSFIKCYFLQGGALEGIAGNAICSQRYRSTVLAWKAAAKALAKNK